MRLAVAFDLDRLDPLAAGIGNSRRAARVGPQRHVRPLHRRPHAAHFRVALRVNLAGKRIAGVAEDAAVEQPERQRRRMQSLRFQLLDDVADDGGVRHRRVRVGPARAFGGIGARASPCTWYIASARS